MIIFVEIYTSFKTRQPGRRSLSTITKDSLQTFEKAAKPTSRPNVDEDSALSMVSSGQGGRTRGSMASVLEMMSLTLAVMPSSSRSRGAVPLRTYHVCSAVQWVRGKSNVTSFTSSLLQKRRPWMISLPRSAQLGRIRMLLRAYLRCLSLTMQRTWPVFCMPPSSLRRRQSSGCPMMPQASPAPRRLICRSIMIFVLPWTYGRMMMRYERGGRPLLGLDHGAHEIGLPSLATFFISLHSFLQFSWT